MGSIIFFIGWSGFLIDKKLQNEFLSFLSPIAKTYNETYFGKLKDKTTLEIFDDKLIEGKILVDKSLLNLPHKERTMNLVFDVSNLIERIERNSSSMPKNNLDKFYICNKIRLNGIQFKVNTGPHEEIADKKFYSKVSFVFAQLENDGSSSVLFKNNIVEVCNKPFLKRSYPDLKEFDLLLYPSGFSYRYCDFSFLASFCYFAKHYFLKALNVNSLSSNDPVEKFLKEYDPHGINEEIKKKAFDYLLNETKSFVEKAYK